MPLRCGIVGLPNVGKSTLFNALTAAGIAAENYPFCTIEPNVGRRRSSPTAARSARRDRARRSKSSRRRCEFVDIAGLVRGAIEGRGARQPVPRAHPRDRRDRARGALLRGRRRDRTSTAPSNPLRDVETIETELGLADLETVEKRLDRVARRAAKRGATRKSRSRPRSSRACSAHLAAGKPARSFPVPTERGGARYRSSFLLTGEARAVRRERRRSEARRRRQRARARARGATRRRRARGVDPHLREDRGGARRARRRRSARSSCASSASTEPGLDRLIRAAYALLDLHHVPHRRREGGARLDDLARHAARRRPPATIHTDFEQHFIRAEVISFDDYVAAGGEAGAAPRASCASRARTTSCRTATSCTSA